MNSPLRILQISDLHILAHPGNTMAGVDTEYSFRQTLKNAHAKHAKVDLILVTGDLAQHPCHSSYQRIYKELEKYRTRTICLPGNHDDLSIMLQVIKGKQINCNKHIQFKHWQIICLNSKKEGAQGGYLPPEEFKYLVKTLEKHPDLNTIIAVHHHPLPTNSPWMDTMMIENNEAFFMLLRPYTHVKTIICGHIHQNLEAEKEGKLILATPSTCFQFMPLCTEYTVDDKEPGYRILELYPNGTVESDIYRLSI